MSQLLRDMARRGVPTAWQKDGRVVRRGGKVVTPRWNSATIREILMHPRTSGHSVYKGKVVKRDAFPAIIPEDRRQALIAKLADPARKTAPGNVPRWLGSLIYQCGACADGQTMTVNKNGQGVNRYRHDCGRANWPAELVDRHVENVMVGLLHRDNVAAMLRPVAEVDAEALYAEVRALEAKKKDAARKNTLGIYDDEIFETILATAEARISQIWDELASGTDDNPIRDFLASDDARATWDAQSLGRQREILRRLLVVPLPPIGRGHKANRELIQITRPPVS